MDGAPRPVEGAGSNPRRGFLSALDYRVVHVSTRALPGNQFLYIFCIFFSKMFEMFEYILLGWFSIFRKLFLRTAPLFSLNRHCLQCALQSTSLFFALSLSPCAGPSITAVIDGTKVLAVLRKCSNSRNMLTLYCITILGYCKFFAVGSALCPGAVVTIRSSLLRNSTVRRFQSIGV